MVFLFSACTRLLHELEKLQLESKHPAKVIQQKTRNYIWDWFQTYDDDIQVEGKEQLLVAIFSTFLPHLRCDRVYGLREPGLIKIVSKALGLGEGRREELERWQQWAKPKDLGAAVEAIVKRCEMVTKGTVDVTEVEDVLNSVAGGSVFSTVEIKDKWKERKRKDKSLGRDEIIVRLLRRCTSWEAKWVVRLLLKGTGPVVVPENPTLESYHFLMPKFVAVQNNLQRACHQICHSEFAKKVPRHPKPGNKWRFLQLTNFFIEPEVGVKIGRGEFVKAKSCQHVVEHMKGRTMYMERKYDGEYCQVHIDLSKGPSQEIKIFSKSGRDSTQDRFAIHNPIRDSLLFHDARKRGFQKNCVLEGELVVWNARMNKILPFFHLRSHVARSGRYIGNANDSPPDPDDQLMILFFDCLFVDSICLLRKPLYQRIEHLHRILVNPIKGRCQMVRAAIIDCSAPDAVEQVRSIFAKGIRKAWEGFVCKPCDAPYIDLARRQVDKTSRAHGFVGAANAWMKLKKDYIIGLGDDADYCIVGGSAGCGKQRVGGLPEGCLTVFYAAVHLNKEEVLNDGAKPKLMLVFELHFSISKRDLLWIHNQPPDVRVPFDPSVPPSAYDLVIPGSLSLAQKPAVLFKSPLVFEITGGGFDKQTNCSFFTPRHPRLSRIHHDRDWRDCISYQELQKLAKETIASQDDGSQFERLWIARLERGDLGKRPLQNSAEGRVEEETPPGKLRRVQTSFTSDTGKRPVGMIRSSTMPEKALDAMTKRRRQEDDEMNSVSGTPGRPRTQTPDFLRTPPRNVFSPELHLHGELRATDSLPTPPENVRVPPLTAPPFTERRGQTTQPSTQQTSQQDAASGGYPDRLARKRPLSWTSQEPLSPTPKRPRRAASPQSAESSPSPSPPPPFLPLPLTSAKRKRTFSPSSCDITFSLKRRRRDLPSTQETRRQKLVEHTDFGSSTISCSNSTADRTPPQTPARPAAATTDPVSSFDVSAQKPGQGQNAVAASGVCGSSSISSPQSLPAPTPPSKSAAVSHRNDAEAAPAAPPLISSPVLSSRLHRFSPSPRELADLNTNRSATPAQDTGEASPLANAHVFLPPVLQKLPAVVIALADSGHGFCMLHELPHDHSKIPGELRAEKKVVLVESRRREHIGRVLETVRRYGGRWEVYDWRVVRCAEGGWERWMVAEVGV